MSLGENKIVSGDSHWSLQGTAGKALNWSGQLAGSPFPFVEVFFFLGGVWFFVLFVFCAG